MAAAGSVARSRLLELDAYGYGVYVAMVVDEAQGAPKDSPYSRLTVRGGEHDPKRRVTEDCLQTIHHFCPDLADWGKA